MKLTFNSLSKSKCNRLTLSLSKHNQTCTMTFNITGKVALISGGASGIGLACVKELLKRGLKGVTMVDVNAELGKNAVSENEREFGSGKVLFVEADVTDWNGYENAFIKTVEVFHQLDIVINNAGIANDAIWEKEIAINMNGVIHGVLLAQETYLPKYRSGTEGVIVNISSVGGLLPCDYLPVYSATKFAVVGLSQAFGSKNHYQRTHVRVLTLCPGATETSITDNVENKLLSEAYYKIYQETFTKMSFQKAEHVAVALGDIIENADSGTVWIADSGRPVFQFVGPTPESLGYTSD